MFTPAYTKQFGKDIKRLKGAGQKMSELKAVMEKLIAGEALDIHFRDHLVLGNWKGRRACHVRLDWLLMDKIDG